MTTQQTTQPTTDPKWLLVSMRSVAVVGLLGLPLLVVWSAVDEHRIAPVVFESWALFFVEGFAIGLFSLLALLWLTHRFGNLNPLPLFLFLTLGLASSGLLGSSLAERSVTNFWTGYDRDHRAAIKRQAEAIPRTGFIMATLAVLLGQRIVQRRKQVAPESQAV